LIVIASFVIFVVNQTSNASAHQQEELASGAPVTTTTRAVTPSSSSASKSSSPHKGAVHKAIDEAAGKFTSPFSSITSGSHSQWTIHIVNTVLALVLYGFGLGYLARVLRVRL
jgi:hypothetical protein